MGGPTLSANGKNPFVIEIIKYPSIKINNRKNAVALDSIVIFLSSELGITIKFGIILK